jgi:NTP pyrophosphatase (non-canonical NTP hydrolase)
LVVHSQWHEERPNASRVDEEQFRDEVAAELADVLIYCLHFANATNTDVAQAILTKLAHNESRFPPERIRGRLQVDSDTG